MPFSKTFEFSNSFTTETQNNLVQIIVDSVKNYQFTTFLIGITWPKDLSQDQIFQMKTTFQVSLIHQLEKLLQVQPDGAQPQLSIYVDFPQQTIAFHFQPVYFFGKYKKFSRNLTQTFPFCFHCKGQGCSVCNSSGRESIESVQELIAEPSLKLFQPACAELAAGWLDPIQTNNDLRP